ncbi:MAG: M48 family metalloprotease [Pseudomonadota bacterium]
MRSRSGMVRSICAAIAMSALCAGALADMPEPLQSSPTILPAAAPTPELARFVAITQRVERIARDISDAAGGECANRWRHPGMLTHTVKDYPRALRNAARNFAGREPSVLMVTDPALATTVQPGDVIIGPAGKAVASSSLSLQAQLALGRMTLRRAGETLTVRHVPEKICYRPVRIIRSLEPKARTKPDAIEISRSLVDFSRSESELAFVIAHEMSHFMLDHPRILASARKDGSLSPALRRRLEREADRGAFYLLSRSGYDPAAGLVFLERTGALRDIPLLGLSSHPTRQERLADGRKTIAFIASAADSPDPDAMQTIKGFVARLSAAP